MSPSSLDPRRRVQTRRDEPEAPPVSQTEGGFRKGGPAPPCTGGEGGFRKGGPAPPCTSHQPLTAPTVRPEATWRWTSRKNVTTGTAVSVAPAISGPQSVPWLVVKLASHTVRVWWVGSLSRT